MAVKRIVKNIYTPDVQLRIANEGGSGTAVPDMSIEVEDIDTVY